MIQDIRLQNFRSYKDATFEFGEGVNIVVGPNASGKTSLLEAVLVSCRGNSYRSSLSDLIMFKRDWARLDAHENQNQRVTKLDMRSGSLKTEYDIAGHQLLRLTMPRTVPVVVFEPDHLQLLTGSPEKRREYLDSILEQTISGYKKLKTSYRRALAQRNALLKQHASQARQLFAWNVRLSELGGQVASYRKSLVEQLNPELTRLYKKLANNKTKVEISYQSSCLLDNYQSDLLKKLEASTDLDYLRGFTAYGPHRDDVLIEIQGHNAQDSASRGEIRTILLALKIVELKQVEIAREQKPILLLDDVFSELDGSRRRALTEFLKDYQTFITTTDADIVVQHFMDKCTIIPTAS